MMFDSNTSQSKVLIIETEQTSENILNIDIPDQKFTFQKLNIGAINSDTNFNEYSLVVIERTDNDTTQIIKMIKATYTDLPVLLVTEVIDEISIELANNFDDIEILFKPVTPKALFTKVKTICEHYNSKKELLYLRQQVAMTYGFDNFVGLSRDIMKIKRNVQHVAADDTTVILTGQDGTGKNLLAKIIHYHSARRHSPFVSLDCSAFKPEQIEKEIFGANTRSDIFTRAENGTVFIDKVHLLDKTVQGKLESLFRRNTDLRLILSATDTVFDFVDNGTLNKSLIDSLNAVEFTLPPLCERAEDIELLTAYFLRVIAYEAESKTLAINPAALELLKRHNWPGNVRELENCLRRAAALCNDNELDIEDISFISAGTTKGHLRDFVSDRQSKKASLAESQRFLISEALDANDWNFTQTAKQLGIGRTTLWRKVRKFKLSKETSNRLRSSGVTTDD